MSEAPIPVDVAAIGTGQATPALATALASRGASVVVFESGLVGGTCVNVGCTPTKTLRATARVAHMARRAGEYGVQVGPVVVDVAAAMARVQKIVTASRTGLEGWMSSVPGLQLVRARARLDGRRDDRFVIRAGDQVYLASRVYLNVGTRPVLPEIDGLAGARPLTNESILSLRAAPGHLIILGGSYIGLEFAQIFRRLGSDVTVLQAAPVIANREAPDISARLTAMLEAEGIRILAPVSVASVARDENEMVRVVLNGTAEAIEGSEILVATGRRPNTDELGLETVGIAVNRHGYVPVDGTLATATPGIWALGDVNGRGAFTHTSWQDHEIVLANLAGNARSVDGRTTTYAMYTDPPLGRIGMHLADARAAMRLGRRFLYAEHEMSKVSRAKEEGETIGVIQVVVDADTHRFAGISMLGIHADEIVQVIAALMAADAPYEILRDFLPIHPTVTEFFPTILGKLKPLV